MPTLVVENGTNVANANSYADLTYLRQYAADRGVELSDDDEEDSVLAIKAMDYLHAMYGNRYIGVRAYVDQALDWPRFTNVTDQTLTFNGFVYAVAYMPAQLKQAQGAVMLALQQGIDLLPIRDEQDLRSERIGPIAFDYFSRGRGPITVSIPYVDTLLAPLLAYVAGLTVVRA